MRFHQRRLERLFLRATSSLGLVSAAACGGSSAGPTIDPATFTESVCDGSAYSALDGLTPATPVDYLELRLDTSPANAPAKANAIASSGTPCKTARDPAACASTLAAFKATGWQTGGMAYGREYLVYTRGDEVSAVTSIAALTSFVTPVDSAKDAALVVSYNGHRIVCNGSTTKNARKSADGGYELVTQSGDGCSVAIDEHVVHVKPDGTIEVLQTARIRDAAPGCVNGRRPEGLPARQARSADPLADFFCEMAHLEGASVFAFERLARELRAHDAPSRLVRAAERAKADEVRHTRTATKLAARLGAQASAVDVPELPVRGLLAIALENAVEGCVGETFAALLAEVQSKKATDRVIARAMRVIARDETRHAALAWEVATWIASRLTAAERAEVARARTSAALHLRESFAVPFADEVQSLAGMPDIRQATALLDAITPDLWAA